MEKSTTDDELLDALRGQIEQLKNEAKAAKSSNNNNSNKSFISNSPSKQYANANSISATYFNGSVGDTMQSSLRHMKDGKQMLQSSMDDSLDFSRNNNNNNDNQQQVMQLQAELQRLKRLCKAQVSINTFYVGIGMSMVELTTQLHHFSHGLHNMMYDIIYVLITDPTTF